MIQLLLQGNPYPEFLAEIERFKQRIDLFEVTRTIADLIDQDNREARLAGIDADGLPTLPLAKSTLEDPRRGPGPPLVPKEVGSRAIYNFRVNVQRQAANPNENAYLVEAGWPLEDPVWFHVTGYVHHGGSIVPARNPWGIRPSAMATIEELFDSYCRDLAEG